MKITAAHITDFKRVRNVLITPDADRYLLLIGGNNAQGKSSVLDALTAALGGKSALPAEAVRRGAEQASIVVELDGGTYRIERTVPLHGDGKLVVTGPDGRIAKPQAWLDKLVGARFLDPLAFLASPPKEQRKTLAALVGLDLEAFEAERKKLYDERTAVGRLLTRAEGELQRLTPVAEKPAAARSQAAIRADLDAIEAEQRAIAEKLAARTRIADRIASTTEIAKRLRGEIARLQAQLVQQDAQLELDAAALAAADDQLGAAQGTRDPGGIPARVEAAESRRRTLREESQRAETLARWEAAAEQTNRRRRDAEDEAQRHAAERDRLTAAIAEVDQRKANALATADMPVDELGVTDDGITLAGIPFDQASQAERLKTALAIAMKLSPNVRDVWVRDGSLLDDDSLDALEVAAAFAGCQIWLERVGEKDEGAIIIRDGRVVAAGGAA